MFSHYIKIAWRNILRKKLFAAINVSGLAIGLCTCLVIFLIVNFELSFDKHHAESDRIYRVYTEFSGTIEGKSRGIVSAAAHFLRENTTAPAVIVPFHILHTGGVKVADKNGEPEKFDTYNEGLAVVEPGFFRLFSGYRWLSGSAERSLTSHSIILTESRARKYFGETSNIEDLIGKTLTYRDSVHLQVSGILADMDEHTDLYFSEFISFETADFMQLYRGFFRDWQSTNSSSQLFVKLLPGKNPEDMYPALKALEREYQEARGKDDVRITYRLQPLQDIHFDYELGTFGGREVTSLQTMRVLSGLGAMILLIASINFVNLETAQAGRRAKEIGIRKVLGSSRKELIAQFLTESLILTLLALTIALPLCQFALVCFQEFMPQGLSFKVTELPTLYFLGGIVLFVGIVSGLYPAFFISSFSPAKALKAQVYSESGKNHSAAMRKALIIFQFSFAQVLIACTFVVIWQTGHMSDKNMGFSSENIITTYLPFQKSGSKKQVLMNELKKIKGVQEVCLNASPPAEGGYSSNNVSYRGGGGELVTLVYRKAGGVDYFPFYDIPIVAGRSFTPNDSIFEMVVNKTYVNRLGFQNPRDVLSEQVELNEKTYTIVGVIDDFHFRSLHFPINPLMVLFEDNGYNLAIKLDGIEGTSGMEQLLAEVESAWSSVYPDADFEYSFLDESIGRFYEAEKRTSKLVSTATIIAIVISCMGLFGQVSFAALQRTKEIGIRKVLGASVESIMLLLSKDFLKLVIIAFIIAAPFAYYISAKWLEDFAYRIEPGPGLFAATGLAALAVALVTVGQQAYKAASENPVKSLRSE